MKNKLQGRFFASFQRAIVSGWHSDSWRIRTHFVQKTACGTIAKAVVLVGNSYRIATQRLSVCTANRVELQRKNRGIATKTAFFASENTIFSRFESREHRFFIANFSRTRVLIEGFEKPKITIFALSGSSKKGARCSHEK